MPIPPITTLVKYEQPIQVRAARRWPGAPPSPRMRVDARKGSTARGSSSARRARPRDRVPTPHPLPRAQITTTMDKRIPKGTKVRTRTPRATRTGRPGRAGETRAPRRAPAQFERTRRARGRSGVPPAFVRTARLPAALERPHRRPPRAHAPAPRQRPTPPADARPPPPISLFSPPPPFAIHRALTRRARRPAPPCEQDAKPAGVSDRGHPPRPPPAVRDASAPAPPSRASPRRRLDVIHLHETLVADQAEGARLERRASAPCARSSTRSASTSSSARRR